MQAEKKKNEGTLCYHTRVSEGSSCVFMDTHSGNVIMIEDERIVELKPLYMDKYGQQVDVQKSKNWLKY